MKAKRPRSGVTSLKKRDYTEIVRSNEEIFENSHVVVDQKIGLVIVRSDSGPDMAFRKLKAGLAVPVGNQIVDEVLYRSYLLDPSIL